MTVMLYSGYAERTNFTVKMTLDAFIGKWTDNIKTVFFRLVNYSRFKYLLFNLVVESFKLIKFVEFIIL